MLYLIGLGLSWKDISLKALEIINKCDKIYLETYTSVSDFSSKKFSLGNNSGEILAELFNEVEEENKIFKHNKKTVIFKIVVILIFVFLL